MSKDARTARMPMTVGATWLAAVMIVSGGAARGRDGAGIEAVGRMVLRQAEQIGNQAATAFQAWYQRTPPMERVTWGGLAACAVLGLCTTIGRTWKLRKKKVVPAAFVERFQRRLADGQLDKGKGLDYCELNPSPASRVALAAVQRWGRPAADLERGVALARQREVDRLRRNVGTLRRIAALAPLIGLLGSLTGAMRGLSALGPGAAWGGAVAEALWPVTIGVALAILALVLYDGLTGRVEALGLELDRIGAETVDALALQSPIAAPSTTAPPTVGAPDHRSTRPDPIAPVRTPHAFTAPHAIRIPVHRGED